MAVITKSHDWISGEVISEALLDGIEDNIINNGLIPSGIEDHSETDAQMQIQVDPYPGGVLSRATALQGELERIRHQLANVLGETYWYLDPDRSIADMYSDLTNHDHSSIGSTVVTAGITDGAVTNPKLGADAVDGTKVGDDTIDSEHYVAGSIDNEHMAANSVDSDQYVDGSIDLAHLAADSVDGTKIADDAIDSEHYAAGSIDTEHIANSQVTEAKLASGVVTQLGQNIGLVAIVTQTGSGTAVNYSGQGRLRGITSVGNALNLTVTIDGVTVFNAAFSNGEQLVWGISGIEAGSSGKLDSLDIHFKTSLVVTFTANPGNTFYVAYERQA